MSFSPVDRLLRILAVGVIAAAAVRVVVLLRPAPGGQAIVQRDVELRERLGLPSDHRLRRLVATEMPPHAAAAVHNAAAVHDAETLRGAAVAWHDDASGVTAIVPDAAGRLRIGRAVGSAAELSVAFLRGLDPSDWPTLAAPFGPLMVHRWEDSVAVYVTVGADGQPGIAGVDDDGDGNVDDLRELGATGSDDQVVAPQQKGYAQAAAGEIVARVISRGALVRMQGDLTLPAQPAGAVQSRGAEVWLEFVAAAGSEPIRLCLQVD